MGKKRKKKPEIDPKPKPKESVPGESYPKTLAELLEKLSIKDKENPS